MVLASSHLRYETWPQRGDPEEHPRDAWDRAQPLPIPESAPVLWHNEARYDPLTQTVLFRRNHTLTTCYSVRWESVTNVAGRAVREAVVDEFGALEVER